MKRIECAGMVMALCMTAGVAMGQDVPSKPATKPAPTPPKTVQPAQVQRPAAAQPTMPAHPTQPDVPVKAQAPTPQQAMPEMTPEQIAEMQAWVEYATPGPEHASMAKSAGEWDAKVSTRMSPEGPWMTSTGTEVNTIILNGLFKETHFSGEVMGQPFSGRMIEGYNKVTRKIESVWVDSMGSGMLIQTGGFSADRKTITMSGEMSDPATGKSKKVKTVVELHGDDASTMRMYDVDATGKEFESMKIEYTRRVVSDRPSVPNVPTQMPSEK